MLVLAAFERTLADENLLASTPPFMVFYADRGRFSVCELPPANVCLLVFLYQFGFFVAVRQDQSGSHGNA